MAIILNLMVAIFASPQKHFYRLQMALFGIFCLTLQKITIYKGYEAFFDYYLSSDLFTNYRETGKNSPKEKVKMLISNTL